MRLPLRPMQPLSLHCGGAWYPSLLLDFAEDRELVVGVPMDRGREVPVGADADVQVDLALPDGIRRFSTVARRRVARPTPGLLLDWPREVRRIQRRQHFRVDTLLRTEVRIPDREGPVRERTLEGFTVDLSEGGARAALPEDAPRGAEIHLTLEFPEYGTHGTAATVVRSGDQPRGAFRCWIACQFRDPPEPFRRAVARFVFDVQRELLRKGIA